MSKIVYRKPYGKTFTYRYEDGKTVKDKALKRWIDGLAIPPAWHDVEIDTDRSAKIHAHGRDDKDRKQYIYNESWTEKAKEEKFNRVLRFARQLETMRRVTGQHLNETPITTRVVLACMTRMLDEAYFRPGSPNYTRNNGTYGLTTLRNKHVDFERGKVVFNYEGKSHKEQTREIHDRRLRKVLKKLYEMPGYDLFDITDEHGERVQLSSGDLNEYISSVMGEDFSAKDFRTWAGTLLMAIALDELGIDEDPGVIESNIVEAVKSVAEELGNTPAIARESYIHPGVVTQYKNGRTLDYFRRQLKRVSADSSEDELAAIHLLEQGL